ncbi:uncharacterized protein L201_005741 [Kwoniella dendrophila CBS 6074]|uniref:FAR1 domain-containing protein n=1 Tax=Kwoniella dendrophila CBS 6074 TaxID=1295534 RepID=A0AAX4K100_9TREE
MDLPQMGTKDGVSSSSSSTTLSSSLTSQISETPKIEFVKGLATKDFWSIEYELNVYAKTQGYRYVLGKQGVPSKKNRRNFRLICGHYNERISDTNTKELKSGYKTDCQHALLFKQTDIENFDRCKGPFELDLSVLISPHNHPPYQKFMDKPIPTKEERKLKFQERQAHKRKTQDRNHFSGDVTVINQHTQPHSTLENTINRSVKPEIDELEIIDLTAIFDSDDEEEEKDYMVKTTESLKYQIQQLGEEDKRLQLDLDMFKSSKDLLVSDNNQLKADLEESKAKEEQLQADLNELREKESQSRANLNDTREQLRRSREEITEYDAIHKTMNNLNEQYQNERDDYKKQLDDLKEMVKLKLEFDQADKEHNEKKRKLEKFFGAL